MSVRTSATVWECSQHSGTELLMLLAIADFADDDGNAYPAVLTLATKCRMKQRNANYILKTLQESGELEIRIGEGPRGTNRYRINFASLGLQRSAGVQSLAGVQPIARGGAMHCAKPLQPIADKPSLNRQEPGESAHAQRSPAAERGSRLPHDWQPSEADVRFCMERRPDLSLVEVVERFCDYWAAQPGAKGRKSSWSATWRTWVRNERAQTSQGSKASTANPWEGAR